MSRVYLLVVIALRSLISHRVKSVIVGAIMFFGTFLVVSGSAILDSMEESMAKSITSSMSGQLQVYAADAQDELSLFGSMGMSSSDIGEIPDFSTVESSLMSVDNVAGVVPMGITVANVYGQNEIDTVLTQLREAVRDGKPEDIPLLRDRVRKIVDTLLADQPTRAAIIGDPVRLATEKEALETVSSDAFWNGFDQDPLAALDYLDSRIAPQSADARMLYLRVIGTDLERFTRSFDRFYIKKGTAVPEGHRGFLMSNRTYEKLVKNKVARDFDTIMEEFRKGTRIADDPLLKEQVERNSKQYQRVVFQLDPNESKLLEAKLHTFLGKPDGDLNTLVASLLTVDDSNAEQNYDFFYKEIGPLIKLYDVDVGDTLTLRAYTKSGYVKSINVRVYGTYDFKGLEDSDLASASNLTDLVTWRELYGKMSSDDIAELQGIKSQVGVHEVTRENAEDELFGGSAPVETTATTTGTAFDEFAGISLADKLQRMENLDSRTYSADEFNHGLALNAAILLKDPSRIAESRKAIEAKIAADHLNLQVVDWQQASGIIGQFVVVMRIVLYTAIFVIFLVALVIINNAMVMATLERVGEIGTIRAIGGRRSFVMMLFLLETVLLGLISGGLGALGGTAFITLLGRVGIPAVSNVLVVLFAGPRLYPAVGLYNLVFGFVVILVVSLFSTLYPAALAARVPPVVAMQGRE